MNQTADITHRKWRRNVEKRFSSTQKAISFPAAPSSGAALPHRRRTAAATAMTPGLAMPGACALWVKNLKNDTKWDAVRTGLSARPLAHSFATLTLSLAPHCSLRCAHSFARAAHSLTSGNRHMSTELKRMPVSFHKMEQDHAICSYPLLYLSGFRWVG